MHDIERLTAALADRYALKGEVGRGAMAAVYLAEDLKHRRRVAIKVLNPELAAVLGPERFLREIELAAGLSHPHILPVHDSGNADGFLFYVMPFVDGESLRDRLKREKQLPVDDALQICREIADGLSYAHAHGIVHRDIKPENILLQSGHAILADFGIAHAIDRAGGEQLTGTGVTVGTPAYMSPEQALAGAVDGRSDLYSLGCVLYELLAGQPPFTGPTVQSIVLQHVSATPPNILQIRPAVPAHVAATLQRALSKTPADRFNPVALFAEALGPTGSTVHFTGSQAPAEPVTSVTRTRMVKRVAFIGGALVAVVVIAVIAARTLRSGSGAAHARTSVAVLPFENLSTGENVNFASGLHNELLSQLAKVASLTVMGRTSVAAYDTTTKSPGEIGDELEVGSIVEGDVQVIGERLNVNIRLLDVSTGRVVWTNKYERTLDDAFAIQSDVAQSIVAELGAALAGSERNALAIAPTKNAEAYRLYLHGQEYTSRPGRLREDVETAQQLYEQALNLDPQFALAHAGLSYAHGVMFWFRYDPRPERVELQRTEAETALRLARDLPEAHWAMGMAHYWGRRDYQAALAELAIATRGLPNDAELASHIGAVHRRLGNWKEVDAAYEKAATLDPRSAQVFNDMGGNTFRHTRRYEDAVRAYDRALSLAPDLREAAINKASVFSIWRGEADSMRAVLARMPFDAASGAAGSIALSRARLFLRLRQPDSLLSVLARVDDGALVDQVSYQPKSLFAAWAHDLRRDTVAARASYVAALAALDSIPTDVADHRIHAARGLALAGLGRKQDAMREAQWLRQSAAYRNDALFGPWVAEDRAMILARVAEPDAALDEVERLLSGPGQLSVHILRADPRWDPIRENPRFKALLVKYASPGT